MSADQSSINPNTPVQEVTDSGPIAVGAGDSPVSFDALERIVIADKHTSKASKAEKKAEAPAPEKAAVEAVSPDKQEQQETKAPEGSDKKQPEAEKAQSLADDAQVEITVNGKKETVSLKDLKNHYSGKVVWDKKFSELDKERKTFIADKSVVEEQISKFFELSEKTPKDAVRHLADIAGVNPVQFMKQLRDGLLPDIAKWSQMSEAERRAAEAEEENQYLKSSIESKSKMEAASAKDQALMAEMTKIREAHGLDDGMTKALYTELTEIMDAAKITPQIIGEYAVLKKSYETVTKAVEGIRPELAADSETIDQLVKFHQENPDLTDDDIKDVIDQAFGKQSRKQSLAKKVNAAARAEGLPTNAAPPPAPKRNPNSDPINFEDL
jgi:hypothetical protein